MSNFDINWLSLIADYGGVVLGLILLIVATTFLPKKIRMYVLTAGITLLIYRTYQIYSARKELAEADATREKLRAEGKELQDRLADMQKEADELREQKIQIEAERDRLKKESEALDTSSNTALAQKKKLDKQADKLLKEGQDMQARRDEQIDALNSAAELAKKFAVI